MIPYLNRRSVARALLAAAAAAGIMCGGGAPTASAQQFVMKFGTQTVNDVQHEFIKRYKTALEKNSGGRIRVELYPASQLGSINRMVEAIRLGTQEGLIGPSELFVGADQRFQALAMPGLFKDIDHARRVFDNQEFRQLLFSMAESRGLVGIAVAPYDQQMFATKSAMAKLADFSGKRIRVLASETEQSAVAALGAAPVPMSLPEVLPALQQGTVDGATSVLGAFVALRYYDAAPNLLETRLWALNPVAVVSRVWLSKLPPDLQSIVRETGREIEPDLHAWQVARIQEDRQTWLANKGVITQLSAPEQEEARRRLEASLKPILEKNAQLKEFYEKIRSVAAASN
jgi:TRAP-type C4-dicarboxylate transport system substrate-binding protein